MMVKRLFLTLIVAVGMPVIGFVIASWIISDIDSKIEKQAKREVPSIVEFCSYSNVAGNPAVKKLCDEMSGIFLLRTASMVGAGIGLVIPVFALIGGLVTGQDRKLLALFFPSIVRISLFLLSISVLVQGAILTYALYIAESYAWGRVHIFLIGGIGVAALAAGISLILASSSFGKKLETQVIGRLVTKDDAPNLYRFVSKISQQLNARLPENIVVGLEPTFYATSADVQVLGSSKKLEGQTLYLSVPLMRFFSENEMATVIGHELGHFIGEDTDYSLKFAPIYSGLVNSIAVVSSEDDEGAGSFIAKIPAKLTLDFILELFARKETAIGRERELRADQAGIEVASAEALVSALVKTTIANLAWGSVRRANIDHLNEGQVVDNLSEALVNSILDYTDEISASTLLETVGGYEISHPTDTHPSIRERADQLGINLEQFVTGGLSTPETSSLNLFENPQVLEQELTSLEHQLMIAVGAVRLPKQDEEGTAEED